MSRFSIDKKARKIALIALIAVLIIIYLVIIIGKLKTRNELDRQKSDMESSVTSILEDNSKIKESIENGDEESYLEQIARDEYSYVNPEERIYYDNDAS